MSRRRLGGTCALQDLPTVFEKTHRLLFGEGATRLRSHRDLGTRRTYKYVAANGNDIPKKKETMPLGGGRTHPRAPRKYLLL